MTHSCSEVVCADSLQVQNSGRSHQILGCKCQTLAACTSYVMRASNSIFTQMPCQLTHWNVGRCEAPGLIPEEEGILAGIHGRIAKLTQQIATLPHRRQPLCSSRVESTDSTAVHERWQLCESSPWSSENRCIPWLHSLYPPTQSASAGVIRYWFW